jgi:hypothetical protein
MTDKVPAPSPPPALAAHAEHLAGLVRDTGDAKWIATADALRVLGVAGAARAASRAWEREWEPYERELVRLLRRANVADAEMARALGVHRQNFQRRHGTRGER